MTMPSDFILVRHGQSEGNEANRRSRKGDHSVFNGEFKQRHSSLWRLTDLGRKQAEMAGNWIRENVGQSFGRYYVSEYIRALETAANLGLPDAVWYRDFYLRERDWGQLDVMSHEERRERFGDELDRRDRDGFYWAPPGGESMATLCLRVDRVLNTLHRECSDKKVISVCHGEVMWAFRVRLERMTQQRYCELDASKHPHNTIHNCQVLHYTRRNMLGDSTEILPHLSFFRSVNPSDLSKSKNEWERIARPKHKNDDLLEEVEKVKQIIS